MENETNKKDSEWVKIPRVNLDRFFIASKEMYRCPRCLRWFKSRCRFSEHIKTHHRRYAEKFLTCETCKRKFQSKGSIKRHRTICSTKIKNSKGLDKKLVNDFQNMKKEGGVIKNKSLSLPRVNLDRYFITSEDMYRCPKCRRWFKSRGVFSEHIKTHFKRYVETFLVCETCRRVFQSKGSIKRHRIICSSRNNVSNGPDKEPVSDIGNELHEELVDIISNEVDEELVERISNESNEELISDITNELDKELENEIKSNKQQKEPIEHFSPFEIIKEKFFSVPRVNLDKFFISSKDMYRCPRCLRWFKSRCRFSEHIKTHHSRYVEKFLTCETCKKKFKSKGSVKRHRVNCSNRIKGKKGVDKKFVNEIKNNNQEIEPIEHVTL